MISDVTLLPLLEYSKIGLNLIPIYRDVIFFSPISFLILFAVFGIRIIPDSLRKCPHGVIGGQTKDRCQKCSDIKIKESLREKWRNEDSRKLWQIFDEEKEKKLQDDELKRKQAEIESRNQRLWEEEKLDLENRETDLKKRLEEKNNEIWEEEMHHISDEDYDEIMNLLKNNGKNGSDIITDSREIVNEYDVNQRKAVWDEIERSMLEKSYQESEDDLEKKNAIRQKAEKIYKEEYEKINYLKGKKISHLRRLSLKSFEKYIIEMFKKTGYVTRISRKEGEAGKIIAIYNKKGKYLLLCKKFPESYQINITDVQKLALAIANQRAIGGFLVTTCGFSKPAFQAAKENHIEPVDVYMLTKMLNEAYPVSYNDERVKTVCLKCGDIVYFNLFDSRDSRTCRYGHEVSNMMINRIQ